MRKWNKVKVEKLYALPFLNLVFKAHSVHRKHFKQNEIELGALLSIKTGTCPEDCAYCPQSGHYQTDLQAEKLLDLKTVTEHALRAKQNGASRFCMGAAWRSPPIKALPQLIAMIKVVKEIGLETCLTLGSLTKDMAQQLHEAGVDYYNHNLDTSPAYYPKIISTRTYAERLQTLNHLHETGINICCGGIVGMGESKEDRIEFLLQLAQLPSLPRSIPINRLIPIAGTPLANTLTIDNFDFIKTCAVVRIMFPNAMVRLSAGRTSMNHEMQALCFMAGANSIWIGNKLLTAKNSECEEDVNFFNKLGLTVKPGLTHER